MEFELAGVLVAILDGCHTVFVGFDDLSIQFDFVDGLI